MVTKSLDQKSMLPFQSIKVPMKSTTSQVLITVMDLALLHNNVVMIVKKAQKNRLLSVLPTNLLMLPQEEELTLLLLKMQPTVLFMALVKVTKIHTSITVDALTAREPLMVPSTKPEIKASKSDQNSQKFPKKLVLITLTSSKLMTFSLKHLTKTFHLTNKNLLRNKKKKEKMKQNNL